MSDTNAKHDAVLAEGINDAMAAHEAGAAIVEGNQKQAKKALGKAKGNRKPKKANQPMSEEALRAKYPHVVEGSMKRGRNTTKMTVQALLTCGHTETLFTSDLFQVEVCKRKECRKAHRKVAEPGRAYTG